MQVNGTKPYFLWRKQYKFDKSTRTVLNDPEWVVYKRYKSLPAAKDAIRAFRRSRADEIYRDYPAMGNLENEAKYPHIRPTITIRRYKLTS